LSEEKVLRIAILAEEPLGWGSGKHYFPVILDDYSWKAGGRTYRFACQYIYDRDILADRLVVKDYDVLLVPGGGCGDGQAVAKGFTFLGRVRRWKKKIRAFVEAGGGYVGVCGEPL
jgi:phosphoribosylformylglycinamidine (FGAM) synthase-like amidotransferase family enzyme